MISSCGPTKKHAKSFDMKFDLNFQRVIIAIALKITENKVTMQSQLVTLEHK